jgi:hypothetical protein
MPSTAELSYVAGDNHTTFFDVRHATHSDVSVWIHHVRFEWNWNSAVETCQFNELVQI